MWQKREDEWEREKRARESLMVEVMEGRQKQLEERMEGLKIQQQETIEQREELLKEIEQTNQMTTRETEDKENKQLVRQRELREQVSVFHHSLSWSLFGEGGGNNDFMGDTMWSDRGQLGREQGLHGGYHVV